MKFYVSAKKSKKILTSMVINDILITFVNLGFVIYGKTYL